ncbi:hypothetical protein [Mucilaginibacter antarcticus]
MRKGLLSFSLAAVSFIASAQVKSPLQKTTFQTGSPWRKEIDVRSDVAIVYGPNDQRG